MQSVNNNKARKLAQLSFFTVVAVTIFSIEAALPLLSPVQGMKLGLANIVTLVLLRYYKPSEVFLVLLTRILLSSLLNGQMMTLLYSLSGGIFCYLAMLFVNHLLRGNYIYLTSILGAVFHNVGQILMALILIPSGGIFVYVPLLMISGIIAGLFTGLCAHFFHKKMGTWMIRLQQE